MSTIQCTKAQADCAKMTGNGIKLFQNSELNCNIRTVIIGEEPWFVVKDVCNYFGETNRNRAMQNIDEEDKGGTQMNTPGGIQTVAIVNESGLYSLLFAMQPEKARGVSDEYIVERQTKLKSFKRWVTHEVLPSIRKHGAYATEAKLEEMLADPDTMILTLQALKTEREKRKALEVKAAEDSPKVLFTDAVMASNSSISIRELARFLHQNHIDIGQNRLFRQLREEGYLCKSGTDHNLPTQRAMELGLFEVKKGAYIDSKGTNVVTRTTKVTGKGQVYFVNKFLAQTSEAV